MNGYHFLLAANERQRRLSSTISEMNEQLVGRGVRKKQRFFQRNNFYQSLLFKR